MTLNIIQSGYYRVEGFMAQQEATVEGEQARVGLVGTVWTRTIGAQGRVAKVWTSPDGCLMAEVDVGSGQIVTGRLAAMFAP